MDAKSFNQPVGEWDISHVSNSLWHLVELLKADCCQSENLKPGIRDMFKGAVSYSYPKPEGAD